jgi:hypothetical protein
VAISNSEIATLGSRKSEVGACLSGNL